jgi:pSer/pThr/pTyr-binding forkhead associated (FHA) protein
MGARLHYLLQDIALPPGTFLIGRGADCQLALDDTMVSRRHAVLHITPEGASIEDLGSRNGVFLNGVRIEKIEPLRDADQIRIGSQDLGYHTGDDVIHAPASSQRQARVTRREMRIADMVTHDPDHEDEQTFVATGPMAVTPGRASGLAIIGGVADKALALGRADEAERVLSRSLADILARAQGQGGEVDAELAERAVGYALRLAGATGRGVWIDYGFKLYTALGLLLPARLVDELYAAVRKVKHADKALLRAYTARLRGASASFGPAERFVLQRIEGLERWAP